MKMISLTKYLKNKFLKIPFTISKKNKILNSKLTKKYKIYTMKTIRACLIKVIKEDTN